jgi:hypothetical protein
MPEALGTSPKVIELAQRQEEFRSRAYLDGANGACCKLRFLGICNGDPATTVACHIHDAVFGFGRKANDLSIIDGCSACHAFLDHGWVGKISRETLLEHIVRGQQETLLDRALREIAKIKRDVEKTFAERAVKPRPPKDERVKIRSNPKIQSAPMRSGNLRRERERT